MGKIRSLNNRKYCLDCSPFDSHNTKKLEKQKLREQCVTLRKKDRLSYNEITDLTSVAKSTLSSWLKGLPLTEEERKHRSWINHKGGAAKKGKGVESQLHKLASGDYLTTQQKGKIAESAVLIRLAIFGFSIYGSFFDGDNADWVIEAPSGRLLKLQVKWASDSEHGVPNIRLKTSRGGKGQPQRYGPGSFDFIIGYNFYTDTCYVWSEDEVKHLKSSVSITKQAEEAWHKLNNNIKTTDCSAA